MLLAGVTGTARAEQTHTVKPGQNLNTIARTYGVSTQELVRTNGIEPPYLIYVGQPIVLPGAASQGTTAVASAQGQSTPAPASPAISSQALPAPANPASAQNNPPRDSPSQNNPVAAAPPPDSNVASNPPEELPSGAVSGDSLASLPPPSASVEVPTGAAPGAFIWPVQGRVLSGFGTKPGGLVNDGINIAAAAGTPVRASQDGTVAYAGNELRGYGNLLLVRHDNGWMTAYAHAGELLVGRGDKVKRGQMIARVGASGNVNEPQLHFEIRQGARSVDPTRYLSGQGISSRS
jgi:murein DD-endopeptidase MepM/ murein hydrolase activator NlpD